MPKLLSSSLAPGAWPRTRIQQQARDLARYTDGEKRPYLHLVDGGLVDNLGLYAFVGELQERTVPVSGRRSAPGHCAGSR